MTSTTEYMLEKYFTPPNVPEQIGSYTSLMIQSRQVAIKIDGTWVDTYDHQNASVLWFIENKLDPLKNAYKIIKDSGMELPSEHVSWKFKAPNGGTFEIVDKRPDGSPEGSFTFRRDNGTESLCAIHHGFNSEEILGVKLNKYPVD